MAARRELVELLAREAPLRRDQLRADALRHKAVGVALRHRAERVAARQYARAHRHPAHRLDTRGDDDVVRAGDHTLGGEADRLLAASALAVDGRPWHRLGESGAEQRVTGDVDGLVADLRYGARDDIVDLRRVDTRARHEFGQAVGQQVHRQHVVQCAAGLALPDRGADRPDDDCVPAYVSGHLCLL